MWAQSLWWRSVLEKCEQEGCFASTETLLVLVPFSYSICHHDSNYEPVRCLTEAVSQNYFNCKVSRQSEENVTSCLECHTLRVKLLHCKLRPDRPEKHLVAITFWRLNDINLQEFEGSLRKSSLFRCPPVAADDFADQMASVITDELNRVAPLTTTTRRPSKPITRWLSKESVAAKRERRRLENVWTARHQEADYVTYR